MWAARYNNVCVMQRIEESYKLAHKSHLYKSSHRLVCAFPPPPQFLLAAPPNTPRCQWIQPKPSHRTILCLKSIRTITLGRQLFILLCGEVRIVFGRCPIPSPRDVCVCGPSPFSDHVLWAQAVWRLWSGLCPGVRTRSFCTSTSHPTLSKSFSPTTG